MATSGKATNIKPMKMTVGFLKARMKEMDLSPERLAELTPISNMTIRRWLQQPDAVAISDKYADHLAKALTLPDFAKAFSQTGTSADIYQVVENLKVDGEKVTDTKKLESQMKKKFKDAGREMKSLAEELWAFASGKKGTVLSRTIAIGALVYFINPFDLIPDAAPVVGYLDDFAVMTLALSQIHGSVKKSRATR